MSEEKKNHLSVVHEPTPLPSMVDGLARYLAEIKRFPLLDADEEYMLAKRWQEH